MLFNYALFYSKVYLSLRVIENFHKFAWTIEGKVFTDTNLLGSKILILS